MEILFYLLVVAVFGYSTYAIIFRKKTEREFLTELIKLTHKAVRQALIIDDDKPSRELIKENLLPLGCKIDEAETSTAAIELVQKNNYDLIFLDMKLYGHDGGNVLSKMPESEVQRTIIITGYYSPAVFEIGAEYGVPIIDKGQLSRHIEFYQRIFLKPI